MQEMPHRYFLDIGIWLYSDVNVLSNKNDFKEKKVPKFDYLRHVFALLIYRSRH